MEKNEPILITGVNGYIASHIANEALAKGFRVLGTVRNPSSVAWLQEYFDQTYGKGRFSLAKVASFDVEGALDPFLEGVSAIAHVANNGLSPAPEPYITETVNSVIKPLESASRFPRIKRFVYTSSSMAAVVWNPNVAYDISPDAYSEEFVKQAHESPFDKSNIWNVYGASKVAAEKAAWKWVADNKPHFGFSTTLPNANHGPSLVKEHQGYPSTGGWPKMIFDNDFTAIAGIPPQHFVDVRDTAKIHVAALTQPGVPNSRLFVFAAPYNWNDVLDILRRLYPQRKFAENFPNLGRDLSRPPNQYAEELLKGMGQEGGWTSLEKSLKDTLEGLE